MADIAKQQAELEAQAKAAAESAAAAAVAAAQSQGDAAKKEPVQLTSAKAVGDLLQKVIPAHESTMVAADKANPEVVKHRYVLNLENNSLTEAK